MTRIVAAASRPEWKTARLCALCVALYTPDNPSDRYCSTRCARASITDEERSAAEGVWGPRIGGGWHPGESYPCKPYPEHCPICRRPWRQILYKARNGHFYCFHRYHYDTPVAGPEQLAAVRVGIDTWAWTCVVCNLLELRVRRRAPERFPRGIAPEVLRWLADVGAAHLVSDETKSTGVRWVIGSMAGGQP